MLTSLGETTAPPAAILVRILVGWVFVSEGVQKFLFPDELGVGRFIKIGIPNPQLTAPFVGAVEVICGLLLLVGLLTRLATIPLLIDMAVAIIATKIPILLRQGLWSMAHEARTDLSMVFGLLFLLFVGSGPWSLDSSLVRRHEVARGERP
jgi:putative oxidoreductase